MNANEEFIKNLEIINTKIKNGILDINKLKIFIIDIVKYYHSVTEKNKLDGIMKAFRLAKNRSDDCARDYAYEQIIINNKYNYFEYNAQYIMKTNNGCLQGTPDSSQESNFGIVFNEIYNKKVIEKYTELYTRFEDDLAMISDKFRTNNDASDFLYKNKIMPRNLKIKINQDGNFLDMHIYKNNNKIHVKTYNKPYGIKQYARPNSNIEDKKVLKSIICSVLRRLIINNSEYNNFIYEKTKFIKNLLNLGYKSSNIRKLSKPTYKNRNYYIDEYFYRNKEKLEIIENKVKYKLFTPENYKEKDKKTFYIIKKDYNNLFDDRNKLQNIINKLDTFLPNDIINEFEFKIGYSYMNKLKTDFNNNNNNNNTDIFY